jgi:opacity protein-like surface antigen
MPYLHTMLLFCLAAAVVPRAEARFRFGLTGGASVASHWSPREKDVFYEVDTRFLNGTSLGALAEIDLSGRFAVRAECSAVQKGAVHDISIPGFFLGAMRAEYRFRYLEFPVQLETRLLRRGRFTLHSDGGFYAASVRSARYVLSNAVFGVIAQDLAVRERWDFGFLFGAGIETALSKVRIGAAYRYSMGFRDVSLPTGPGLGEIQLRNQCYQFLFSIIY